MRRPLTVFSAVLFTLAALLTVPGDCLFAQTNFVKYAGNPILPLGNLGEWDDAEAAYAHVFFDGTTHHLWYSGGPQVNRYRIGYASSPDGVNWNKHANNPVLSVSSSGFDNVDTWTPMVLFDGAAYQMWYTGNSNSLAIGYATAADPVSWTKHTGNPVIAPGGGAWEQNWVFAPIVIRTDTLYHMWYSGLSASNRFQSGYATSADGLSWSKHSNNPVLPVGASGEWDAVAAIAGSVIFADGQFQMWYHGTTGDPYSNWKIGYATSPDGVNWTKHSGNPILQPGGGWDAEVAGFPRVIKDGHRYRMWYTGRRLNGAERLGYAEDFNNAAHTDSIRVSANSIAASSMIFFAAYIANPHSENLTVQALIKSNDGSVNELVDLTDAGNGVWRGEWVVPANAHDYSVGVELNNLSAGYVHNSFDWGVSDEFSTVGMVQFTAHTITTNASGATGVSAADLDGDGDMDVLSADYFAGEITWYENDGSQNFTAHTVATGQAGAVEARPVDLDGDGDIDVISAAAEGDRIAWHENDGNENFTTHTLITGYNCAIFTDVVDLDEDGDMDVLAAACIDDRLIWLENDGNQNFTTHIIATGLNNATIIRAADVDGDGDWDLLSSEWDTGGAISWYENDGNENFTANDIVTGPNGFFCLQIADLDDDGEIDLISTTPETDEINWHENDGNLSFTTHTITTDADSVLWVDTADLDGDGDIDVISASQNDDKVAWYENDGDENFTVHVITTDADLALKVFAANMDGDGDIDVLSASANDNKIAWYENNLDQGTSVEENAAPPSEFALEQNYPNPFNPSTTIEFSLLQHGFVTLKVYNLLGEEVANLLEAHKPAGRHSVNFDASALASGLYYYTLTAGDPSTGSGQAFKQSRKMLLLR